MSSSKTTRRRSKTAPSIETSIRDRIKELRRVRAGDLAPNPKNWRRHPAAQRDALLAVLKEIGYADALLARELEDGRLAVIDGHLRQSLDDDQVVPVLVLDVDEAEAEKLLLTLDPISAMAVADSERLAILLGSFETEDEALRAMLDGLARDSGLVALNLPNAEPPPQDPALRAEHFVELYCSTADLNDFRETLESWSKRETVTLNIS